MQHQPLQTTQPRRLFDEESSNEDEEESNFNYNLDDEDDEPEPEPEPEPQTRKRGKAKGKEKEPVQQSQSRLIWKDKEVKALAQAWLEVSEADERGNDQDLAAFRQRVWEAFCTRMRKVYRNPTQIYAKWRPTNKSVMKFNGIYVNFCRQPPSGANQMDIIGLAEQQYADVTGTVFKSKVFWDVVKNHPKWLALKSPDDFTCGRGSKRSKTSSSTYTNTESSDGRTGIDLNVEEEPSEPPTVHVGRDAARAKRKQKGVADSSSGATYTSEHLQNLNVSLDGISKAKQVKAKKAVYKMLEEDPYLDPEVKKEVLAKARQDLYKTFSWI
ncbi:hypothetical protein LXL04_009672 [Taraxacum kok-saghyz]